MLRKINKQTSIGFIYSLKTWNSDEEEKCYVHNLEPKSLEGDML